MPCVTDWVCIADEIEFPPHGCGCDDSDEVVCC